MSADEFETIARYFAPLAAGAGARGLLDDVAVLRAAGELVITTDAIVEGVHFLPADPIETVAKKALRVNLSDLAAKGARPLAIMLTLIWPKGRPSAEIEGFARGLGEDLQRYGVALLGGDTTSTPGPLTVSIAAFGAPLGPRVPARADAAPGQQLWTTGRIGDAYLGLRQLQAEPAVLGAAAADQIDAGAAAVRAAYRLPEPPVGFAAGIARFAIASMDISDGLLGDAGKIAAASGVALRIDAEAVPLSASGHAFVQELGAEGLIALLSGGDDYQALFTAAAADRAHILAAARAAGIDAALIGAVEPGPAGVRLVGAGGAELPVADAGHRHRLGR